jgi:hypothetical protein
MRLKMNPQKSMAALCAFGATNFLMSGAVTQDALPDGEKPTSLPQRLLGAGTANAAAQNQPNIVLIFLDNFGWGEPGFNGGGIVRGAETPRMDQIAAEGLRLTNFNVEAQSTPSRSAIMSGRYAFRSGNGVVPLGSGPYGLVQWEYTMATRGLTNGTASRIPPTSPPIRVGKVLLRADWKKRTFWKVKRGKSLKKSGLIALTTVP